MTESKFDPGTGDWFSVWLDSLPMTEVDCIDSLAYTPSAFFVLCFFFAVLPAYSALLGTLISLLLLLLLVYFWLSAHLPPLCSVVSITPMPWCVVPGAATSPFGFLGRCGKRPPLHLYFYFYFFDRFP
ncbi:unnamed protein product, partial [Ectocarpus sp. 12 AP-2014]